MPTLSMQRLITGVDAYREPQDLPPNRAAKLDNMLCYAGIPQTRPGVQGLFATPLTKPIWSLMPYVNADETTTVFFVSGNASDGHLYQTAKGSSTYSATTGTTTNINSPLSRLERIGSRGYLVDGTNPIVV